MVVLDATTSSNNAALVVFIHNEWAEIDKAQRRHAVLEGSGKQFLDASKIISRFGSISRPGSPQRSRL